VQHLRFLMEPPTDAVATILANDAAAVPFCMLLNDVPNVSQAGTGPDHLDPLDHTLVGDANHPLGQYRFSFLGPGMPWHTW